MGNICCQRKCTGQAATGLSGKFPDDKAAKFALFEANYRFFGAPVVIYLCMDSTLTHWSFFDIGMLAQSIMIAAQEYGLGSIPAYMLAIYPDLIRAELEIPEGLSIMIGVALGYSDTEHPQNKFRSSRRPIEEVVRFKLFSDLLSPHKARSLPLSQAMRDIQKHQGFPACL